MEDVEKIPYPAYGVVKGFGRCKVLSYEGNGYFMLLTIKDEQLFQHRSRITFLSEKKEETTSSE